MESAKLQLRNGTAQAQDHGNSCLAVAAAAGRADIAEADVFVAACLGSSFRSAVHEWVGMDILVPSSLRL